MSRIKLISLILFSLLSLVACEESEVEQSKRYETQVEKDLSTWGCDFMEMNNSHDKHVFICNDEEFGIVLESTNFSLRKDLVDFFNPEVRSFIVEKRYNVFALNNYQRFSFQHALIKSRLNILSQILADNPLDLNEYEETNILSKFLALLKYEADLISKLHYLSMEESMEGDQ